MSEGDATPGGNLRAVTPTPSFEEIVLAQDRIRGGVVETPLEHSAALSELLGAEIWTKPEYRQRTGSFKERGARNALARLGETRGVIAASAGNHALALAYHGRELGIPTTVVMPRFAPLVKRQRCAAYGARVLLHGDDIQQAKVLADELVASEGLDYVHGFDGRDVIAGAGTIGLELAEQRPDLDAVIVPVGGAGLIAGVGLAMKTLRPACEIVGVEPDACPSFARAMELGEPEPAATRPTLADGLAVPTVGTNAFALARTVVDRTVTVDEESIALAILRLLEMERAVVEGGGAATLAAFLAGRLDDLKGKRVALLLCGGNIDPAVLGRIIVHGLVADGRLLRFRATISDRPGGLARFTADLAETGASVRQIAHERAFAHADVSTVDVEVVAEASDRAHAEAIVGDLRNRGYAVTGS